MSNSINLSNQITVKLGDLGYTYPGLSGKSKDDFGFGKPYIPYMNIFSNCKIKKSFLEYVDIKPTDRQNKVQTGDLFFTTSSETVEEVGMTSVLLDEIGEAYLNSFCFGFRLYNFDILLPEFAAFLFRGDELRKKISLFGQGSTRYNLPKTQMLQKLNLNLPDKIQQRKIAHILTTCDSVIGQTQTAIAKYKAIKQGLLHDLFTRGLDTNGKLRPSYPDAPELYKESELGMIPKEWDVKRLQEIAYVNPPTNIPSTFNSKTQVTFLKMEDVSNSGSIIKNRSLSIGNVQKRGFTLFQENDVLFAKITPCMENGKGALATNLFNGIGYGSTEFHVFRPRDKKSISYVYFLSVSSKFRLQGESQMTGSAGQQRVSTKYLENYKIAAPKSDEQFQIGVRLNNIDNKIKSEETLLQKYQSIKRGLMGDLLGGRKR